MIRDVSDLEVYNHSLLLLRKLYEFLKKLPKSEYDTVIQCKRCGKSIPANIAEGFAKRSSDLEFKRFLKIAITVPRLLQESKELAEEYKVISKRLNKLQMVWRSGAF